MKIRKINFLDHPILGNLGLDFTDENGKIIDTIIFAGENGTGKSTLLEELYNACSPERLAKFETFQEYEVLINIELNDNELSELKFHMNFAGELSNSVHVNYVVHASRYQSPNVFYHCTFQTNDGTTLQDWRNGSAFIKNIRRVIFSETDINYNIENISNIGAKYLDEYVNRTDKSSNNSPTDIVQLLIDVHNSDSEDIATWVRNNPGSVIADEILQNQRMNRFTKAFDYMFPTKRFKGVINALGNKKIVFTENNKTISIDELSSGEKQIVFRGSYLLRNKKSNTGALVLIDEPEISLHPKWQLKILDYYKKLLQDDNGNQTSQMFIVTHSPFIIHNTSRSNDKVIILKKKDDGTIEVSDKQEFYGWTSNQLVQEAFDIDLFTDTTPVVFLEGETDEMYFNKALEVYNIKEKIQFKWIGRVNNNQAEFTGDKSLNHTKAFLLANNGIIKNKIVLLYDCDTNKPKEDYNNLLIRCMKINNGNTLYKKGIENQLQLPDGFDSAPYYTENEKVDDNSAVSIMRSLNKTKLCKAICSMSIEEQKKIFQNIKECIETLISEL